MASSGGKKDTIIEHQSLNRIHDEADMKLHYRGSTCVFPAQKHPYLWGEREKEWKWKKETAESFVELWCDTEKNLTQNAGVDAEWGQDVHLPGIEVHEQERNQRLQASKISDGPIKFLWANVLQSHKVKFALI